jgi:hypothetical protein
VRQLRIQIQNELRGGINETLITDFEKHKPSGPYAST